MCHRAAPDGLVLTVRLTPKATQDAVDGAGLLADGSQAVLARALPEKARPIGPIALRAETLKFPRGLVTIVGGAGGRSKRVRLVGDEVERWPKLT